MAYNLQDDAIDYPDLGVLDRSRDDWLGYQDVDDLFRLHETPTFSLDPVDPYVEGLFLYHRFSICDTIVWQETRYKRTLENPVLYYEKSRVELVPMDVGMKTIYERRVYTHPDPEFAYSELIHYRLRSMIDDGESEEDTGEDTEPEDSEDDAGGNGGEDNPDVGNEDTFDSDSDGDDAPAPSPVPAPAPAPAPPLCNGHVALIDVSAKYIGSEIMREVAWIICDVMHYRRDSERAVVWEESIVSAPKNSRFMFLSATVPNAKEFTDWVAKVHKQPFHIVYTAYRPNPLQHYLFSAKGDRNYLVVDEKAKLHEHSFQKYLDALVPANDGDKKRENGKSRKGLMVIKLGEESVIFKFVRMLIQRQDDPVSLFSFREKECEALAMQLSKMDLNNYIANDNVVELKGEVTCEISSVEELTLTELVFSGLFKEATVEDLVSLLSDAEPREELDLLFIQLQDTARPDIMVAVYAWAKGSKFYGIFWRLLVFSKGA